MENCRCEAIVLGVMDYRESDKIVTLFTLEQGKLKGVAGGAKRSVRRFGGCLEPFSLIAVQLSPRAGLARLAAADLSTVHSGIRRNLQKIAYAGYACEAVDFLLPEGLTNPRLFRLLSAYLERLDSAPPAPSDRRFFQINLLNILGYRPSLEGCSSCGALLSAAPDGCVAGPEGLLLCSRCGRGGRRISPSTLSLLKASLCTGRFGTVFFAPDELAEAGSILDAAIACHLDRPLKSVDFLREMERDFLPEVS